MNDKDFLFNEAKLGLTVEDFIRSPVGKYLVDKAKSESDSVLEQIMDADADDKQLMRQLQFQLKLPHLILDWLGGAMQNGNVAEASLQQLDQDFTD